MRIADAMPEPNPFKEPDLAEIDRIAVKAREADQRIAAMEARLLVATSFDALLEREKALASLYNERRKIGDDLLAASRYLRKGKVDASNHT